MHKRIKKSLLTFVIVFAAFMLSGSVSEHFVTAAPVSAASYELLSALPTSDFIIYVNTQRVLTDIIPTLFVEQPEARAQLERNIERIKEHTAFDPRLLDAIAVGLNFGSQNSQGMTFSIIARGRFDANNSIDAGLTLAIKESRGELTRQTKVYEGRTIQMLVRAGRTSQDRDTAVESESRPSDQTMVFVALDSNTVAFGNLKSVRATIDASLGRGRVDAELVQLASTSPNAAASFGGKVPPDMTRRLHLGNKDAENSFASMKQIYGSFNVSGTDAEALVNVRMEANEDARRISMALNALKFLAKIGAPEASAERKSIEAMIRNFEIYAVGNEVQITARVPLADLAPLVPKH